MPKAVSQAIRWIWITIALSVLAALVNKWTGAVLMGEFVFNILIYALFCMFPYKLAKGSNPARWVYAVVTGISLLLMLGGIAAEMPAADVLVSIVTIPMQIYILVLLFRREASGWFGQAA